MFYLRRIFRFCSLSFLFLLQFSAWGQTADKKAAIDQIFSDYHKFEGFQGTVLVADQGKVIYKKAFGLANREWNIPNQVSSRYDIASISKQFTALLVMQLHQEGKLALDSTISAYYPEYRQDIGRRVTIHHLLTHRSGIPNYTSVPYVWSDSLVNRYSTERLVQQFCSGELEFAPGTRYSYNNTGYFLLSVILEKVSGKSFENLLRERILEPLHMQHSGVDDREAVIAQRAYGYTRDNDIYKNARPMHMANLQGAGNMYSTVEDLYRWDRALHENKLLSRQAYQQMTSSFSEQSDSWIPPYQNSYGYGMGTAQVPIKEGKTKMVFHSGHITGYSSFMARFEEEEHLVVLLSNTGNVSTARMNEIVQEVKQVLYDPAYRTAVRSLRSILYNKVQESGFVAALQTFDHLTESFPYEYQEQEEEIYQLTIDLLANQQPEAALSFSRLNARLHPNWKTYHLLAEILQQRQNPDEAIEFFKKSMQLNPQLTEDERNAYLAAQRTLDEMNP